MILYLFWISWRIKSAGAHQERIWLGLPVLHFRVISENHVFEEAEEVFVAACLHLKSQAC